MKVVVVGNGLAGTLAAKTLRELDPDVEIEIIGEETYPYYPRPNLIEYLAGRLPYEKLFGFPEGWAEKQRIVLRLGEKAARIRPAERTVETASGAARPFDALLLASGARAAVPPIPGMDKKGVFVLRTLDDVQALIERLSDHKRVAVLGGGLLGLEIARAVREREAEVEVVELFDRLLPRQLDPAAAAVLKSQFEARGIAVRLKAVAKEVLGEAEVRGLRFEAGDDLEADTLIVAAGIKPEVGLASEAGLRVGKGVIVDDRMRSSAPGIFAAGDAAEHRGRVYGIIPAAFEQARAAAYNILSQDKPYGGTLASNTLKVAGLYLTSVGEIDADEPECEAVVRSEPEAGLYKKIVLCDGRVVGAIWMGTKKGAPEISRLAAARRDVRPLREELLQDDYDFSEIL
ncbi:MAG: NAD(P)/FAD-dependent oxidoreductase [Candidatus Aminicenantes bacterium]|nr:NAD(P)/FAD-dependent oxidoreductase [Candidatus Aminicenantes bacterium]